jgi:serine protease
MRKIVAITALLVLASAVSTATLRVPGQYADIQAAIDASSNGDTVLVAPGFYSYEIGFDIVGKSIHVVSEKGPEVTTIANRGYPPSPWESGSYAFSISSAPGPCTISGFTMGGHGPGDMSANDFTIRVHDSDVKITGNRFGGNHQLYVIDVEGQSAPVIEYNLFTGNMATSVYVDDGTSPTIQWNTFSGNTWHESIRVWGNTCHPVIRHNIIVNGLCLQPSPYCDANGIRIDAPPENVVFECNDVWNNPTGNYQGSLPDQTGINGNISADPLFCGAAASGNFYLQAGSPCAGSNVPGACAGQSMGCYAVQCAVAVQRQSWGSIKSLFNERK